jgi:glycosyltransferase involved in cell wall biosynthesis
MKVLTFTSLFPNSLQPWHGFFVYQRVAHLARRSGNVVSVVAPVPYVPFWIPVARWRQTRNIPSQEVVGELRAYHPRYFFLPKISMPYHGLLMYAGSVSLVRRLHEIMNFDCIDAHYVYPDGFAAVLLGRSLGIPVVVSARGTDMTLFPTFRLVRPLIRWTLRRAAGVVGVCEALKETMTNLGTPAEKACVIGNGIDLDRFERVNRTDARRKLGIPEDAEIILSVGNLIPVKGYQFLIPAIAQMVSRHPTIKLYIVGEGGSRKKLEAQASDEGVRDRILFVGRKPNEDLKYWYSAADVSCLASSREGWANVLLESLACGTPVVATRVWGTPEVIVSPKLGVLVEQNKESLAQGLECALEKQWNHTALVEYAATRTWDVVAREVQNFLEMRIAAERLVTPGLSDG